MTMHAITTADYLADREGVQELCKIVASGTGGQRTGRQVLLAALLGAELGWGLMMSQRMTHVMHGQVTLSADAYCALARTHPDCLDFRVVEEETDERRCTCQTLRRGGEPERYTFTLDDAHNAGLRSPMWKKFPAAMLRARAASTLARRVYPDAIAGLTGADSATDIEPHEPTMKAAAND